MRRGVPLGVALLLALALAAGANAKIVAVTTRLDRTAVWVGDPLRYTIHVVHDPSVEFAVDNLTTGSVALAPFILREVKVDRRPWGSGQRLLEIVLTLTSYETGRSELQIPALNLYYFVRQPGRLLGGETPAEVISVPAERVGLRSTLTADPPKPREPGPPAPADPARALVAIALGLAGMAVVIVGAGHWLWRAWRRQSPARRRVTRQAHQRWARQGLADLRAAAGASPDDCLRFCTEVSGFLRQYVGQLLEVEATALTPEEIETLFERAGTNIARGREVRAILVECEAVRYGPHRPESSYEWQTRVLARVEQVIQS